MRTCRPEAPGRDRPGTAGAHFRAGARGERSAPPAPWGGHVDLDRGEPELTPALAEVVAAWPLRCFAGGGGRGPGPAHGAAAHGPERGAARAAPPAADPGPGLAGGGAGGAGGDPGLGADGRGGAGAAGAGDQRRGAGAGARDGCRRGRCSTPRLGAGGRAPPSPAARWRCAGRRARRRSPAIAGAVAQALDNLVVNAIEHGGPEIVVEARDAVGAAAHRRGRLRPRVAAAARGARARPS